MTINKGSYQVQRRRRREGRTNYHKRYDLLKSKKPRLVVRARTKIIIAHIVNYIPKGDVTIATTNSLELKKFGWTPKRNIPTAYLTGLLIGKKALKANVKEAILDIGIHKPHRKGRLFAVLKGAIDAGLKIPHDEKALPSEDRIQGKHIEEYRKIKLNFDEIKAKVIKWIIEEEEIEGQEEGKKKIL